MKFTLSSISSLYVSSLPLRERGLKSSSYCLYLHVMSLSLPLRERGLKYLPCGVTLITLYVAPLAGAWIEILCSRELYGPAEVAPLAGAWIEITHSPRSLKSSIVAPLAGAWIEIPVRGSFPHCETVAPLAGAWIEIQAGTTLRGALSVAPLAGAWIEISLLSGRYGSGRSLPLRERGLKSESADCPESSYSRSPCGSVD